jgi:hypothetical protein
MTCTCGARIGMGSFPNDDVFKVISETQYDSIEDPVDRASLEKLFVSGFTLCRCKNCGTVIIIWEKGKMPTFYKLD